MEYTEMHGEPRPAASVNLRDLCGREKKS